MGKSCQSVVTYLDFNLLSYFEIRSQYSHLVSGATLYSIRIYTVSAKGGRSRYKLQGPLPDYVAHVSLFLSSIINCRYTH